MAQPFPATACGASREEPSTELVGEPGVHNQTGAERMSPASSGQGWPPSVCPPTCPPQARPASCGGKNQVQRNLGWLEGGGHVSRPPEAQRRLRALWGTEWSRHISSPKRHVPPAFSTCQPDAGGGPGAQNRTGSGLPLPPVDCPPHLGFQPTFSFKACQPTSAFESPKLHPAYPLEALHCPQGFRKMGLVCFWC